MDFMKIGEVATQSGVGIETIRFYERERLIPAPLRTTSGYRQYEPSVIARLSFIRRTKELGFTLAEIRDLLELRFDPATGCEHVRERAQQKLESIAEKIHSLERMKRTLEKVVSECETKSSIRDCPLLDGLDDKGRS